MELTRTQGWYWLASLDLFSPEFIDRMMLEFGSPEELFFAEEKRVRQFFQIAEDNRRRRIEGNRRTDWMERFFASRNCIDIVQSYNNTLQHGIQFITEEDTEFPQKLRQIEEKPHWLFFMGELPEASLPAIAIIGARKCSSSGKELARSFASSLALQGVIVISGMAEGIDGAAHAGALCAGAKTYAILGSGIDICYPKEHEMLYKKIIQQGGVLSEYPPGSPGVPFHFPMRNRLIAGLADGILVIEARERSGSLITVDRGLEQGKEIYAVPGRPGDALSFGCNRLIQSGAKLTLSSSDILEDLREGTAQLNPVQNGQPVAKNIASEYLAAVEHSLKIEAKKKQEEIFNNNLLETKEKIVYASLSLVPKHVEFVCAETGIPINQLYPLLLSLKFKEKIRETEKNYYVLNQQL